jgi:hypothetical protein
VEAEQYLGYPLRDLPGFPRKCKLRILLVTLPKEDRAMRKRMSRRPEVETLESMTLLSGIGIAGGGGHAVQALAKTAPLPNPLVLTGTLTGNIQTKKGHHLLSVKGNLSPIGKVNFSTTAPPAGLTAGPTNLVIPHGTAKLFLTINLTTPGTSLSGTYTVTGGTKNLAGETGSGNVSAMLTGPGPSFIATLSPA